MDVQEIKELTEHLSTLKIATAEDLSLVIGALHEGMDARDEVSAAATKATEALKRQLDEATAPFVEPAMAAGALVEAAKAAIVRHLEAEEQARLTAVKARTQVPAPLPRPKGLTVKQALQLVHAGVEKLPDEFLMVVADADAVLAAVETGAEFDGVETTLHTTVSYRRPK